MTESFVRPGNTMEIALPETALVNLFNFIPEYGDYKERIRNGSRENYLLCIKQRALVITPSTSVSYHLWKHRPVLIFLEQCPITIWAAGGKFLQGTASRVIHTREKSGLWA